MLNLVSLPRPLYRCSTIYCLCKRDKKILWQFFNFNNKDVDLSSIGPTLFKQNPGLVKDLERFDQIASDCKNGGPFLFGEFSGADAYFSPIAMRITRYGLPMSDKCKNYVEALCNLSSVREWVNGAVQEKEFLECEELYRKSTSDSPTA